MAHDDPLHARASELGDLLLSRQKGYGFAFMDAGGIIVDWTAGAEWITGWTPTDMVGQSIAVMFTPEDRVLQLDRHELNLARRLGSAEDERWHLRKNASRFWASGFCWSLGMDKGFVKVFKDATHLRARTEVVENEARHLHDQSVHRDDILGIVAHELRNPLTPIKAAASLLERRGGNPEMTRLTRIIQRQVDTMERLVEDLVDITRAHSGKLSMDCRAVELQATLAQAFDGIRPAAATKGVNLELILPPKPITVEIDAVRIQQVVSNLLNNAIRFSEPGGRVSLSATVDATHFFLQVRDNGAGIGPELLPCIFDLFTQATGTSSGRGEGLGIGLAVVKEIVGSHDGSIEVRSEGAGKGSEFTARIPVARPAKPG